MPTNVATNNKHDYQSHGQVADRGTPLTWHLSPQHLVEINVERRAVLGRDALDQHIGAVLHVDSLGAVRTRCLLQEPMHVHEHMVKSAAGTLHKYE